MHTKRGIRMSLNSHHTNHPTQSGLKKAFCQKLTTTAFSSKTSVYTWGSWTSKKFCYPCKSPARNSRALGCQASHLLYNSYCHAPLCSLMDKQHWRTVLLKFYLWQFPWDLSKLKIWSSQSSKDLRFAFVMNLLLAVPCCWSMIILSNKVVDGYVLYVALPGSLLSASVVPFSISSCMDFELVGTLYQVLNLLPALVFWDNV